MRTRPWLALGVFVGLTFAAAAVGGAVTASSVKMWYPTLAKPSWTPPSAVFGPVWSLLYGAMAVAAWLVWRSPSSPARVAALRWYFVQLALNTLWSFLFFGWQKPALAFVEIVLLWAVLLVTFLRFRAVDRVAAWLWLPYLAWVTFAAALNGAIWHLNG